MTKLNRRQYASLIAVGTSVLICLLVYQTKLLLLLFLPLAIPALLLVLKFPFWTCLLFIVFSFFRIH